MAGGGGGMCLVTPQITIFSCPRHAMGYKENAQCTFLFLNA